MSANYNIEDNKKLKENPFKTPDNYFESLNDRLKELSAEEPKVVQFNPRKRMYRFISIAATLLILLTAGWYFSTNSSSTDLELTQEEVLALVEGGYLETSELVLLDALSLDDLNALDNEESNLYEYYEELQPEVIEDYYLYDNI